MLRYLWQQIHSYQQDLISPLEVVLKGVIEEHKSVYTRCQEQENTLHLKVEQHEREIDSIYEDFEKITQKELLQLEKKHLDRGEVFKTEFGKIIEQKEQAYLDIAETNLEITERLEQCGEEIENLQVGKHMVEKQCRQLLQEQQQHIAETDQLAQENEVLKQKLKAYDDNIRELQHFINQMTKTAEDEKEKHRRFMRKYKDLLEEKEFLNINVSNLSMENNDLRNINKSLTGQDCEINVSMEILDSESVPSPLITVSTDSGHFLSLHDEINAAQTDESQIILSPLEMITPDESSPNEIFERLSNQHLEDNEGRKSMNLMLNDIHASTPIKSNGLRLVSAIQSGFKIIFCGDSSVGKTSLIHRICFERFSHTCQQTVQVDSYQKTLIYNDTPMKLNFWDTVGQERYNSLPRSYYRKSDLVILLYDITEESSFTNAKSWLRSIHDFTDESALLLLVGSKLDLAHKRSVLRASGEMLAKDNDAIFVETSAKSEENLDKLLDIVSSTLLERDETVIIRNDFEQSLCSLNYKRGRQMQACC